MSRAHTSGQYIRWTGTLFAASTVTMACWFKIASGQGGWLFTGEPNTGGSAAYAGLYVDPGSTFVRIQYDPNPGISSAQIAQTANGVATPNVWHHWMGRIFSGSGCTVTMDGGAPVTGTGGAAYPGFAMVETGRLNTNGASSSGGVVAECAIWNTPLTDAEGVALAKGVSPLRVRPGALQLHWPLWAIASPEPDLSGNVRNGAVTGATAADHGPVGRPWPFAGGA